MSPLKDTLLKWTDELEKVKMPKWDLLPDIDLYMDQVITYLEKQTSILTQYNDEKLVTSSMINNYVKNEVIPRPIKKKYGREHLAHLMAVLSLKQVLSLSEISKLISYEINDKSMSDFFDQLNSIQNEAFKTIIDRVKDSLEKLDEDASNEETENRLSLLALMLSLEANASRISAKKIIDEIMNHRKKEKE